MLFDTSMCCGNFVVIKTNATAWRLQEHNTKEFYYCIDLTLQETQDIEFIDLFPLSFNHLRLNVLAYVGIHTQG